MGDLVWARSGEIGIAEWGPRSRSRKLLSEHELVGNWAEEAGIAGWRHGRLD